jgi:uncharacterized membrane protein
LWREKNNANGNVTTLAGVGVFANDIFAIASVIGSLVLFFGAFFDTPLRRYGEIANWSLMGLVFGVIFQISMVITKTVPEKIGLLFQMTPALVTGLLGLSFLLLLGRWWIRRNRYRVW